MEVVTLCRAEMEQMCVESQVRRRKHRVATPITHFSTTLQRSRARPCYSEHSEILWPLVLSGIKTGRSSGVTAPFILNIDTRERERGQWSAPYFRTHYSLAIHPFAHWGGWLGIQAVGTVKRTKKFLPLQIIEPRVLDCPAPSLVIILTELSRLFHIFVQINAQSMHWFWNISTCLQNVAN